MAGRPRKEIDREAFEELCAILCTESEIAGFFHCDKSTLLRWCRREYRMPFADIYKELSDGGKISLRRALMRQAETKPAVAIFLAKCYLGMRDNEAVTSTDMLEAINAQTLALAKLINEPQEDREDLIHHDSIRAADQEPE